MTLAFDIKRGETSVFSKKNISSIINMHGKIHKNEKVSCITLATCALDYPDLLSLI